MTPQPSCEELAREIVERTRNRSRWDMENQTYVPETFPWLEKDIAAALQLERERAEKLAEASRGLYEACLKLPEMECKNSGNFKVPHCPVCGFIEALAKYKEAAGES